MSEEGQNAPEAVPSGASRGQGLMEESLVTTPPPLDLGPFPMPHFGGASLSPGRGLRTPATRDGVGGGCSPEFTAQSLAEKKAFSGQPSLQGSREEGGGGEAQLIRPQAARGPRGPG